MDATVTPTIEFRAATAEDASSLAPLVYDSAHELFDFMLGGRLQAEKALTKLLAKPAGHFGYRHATVLGAYGEIAGVVLGYDRKVLAGEEFTGTLNLLRAAPLSRWPHLVLRAGRALSGYVPPPSSDAWYINNIAVDSSRRGAGLGKSLLEHVAERAEAEGYRCLELDVTAPNSGAIRFYEANEFHCVSESGTESLEEEYGLPRLKRMRRLLTERRDFGRDNYGHPTSSRVVNDVSGLNPVEVDEVYTPGSVEQLQVMLRASDKPVSVGGGRFSMGGQTAVPGTLHIDVRGLNRVLEVDSDERTVRVEAGARWKDVQRVIDDYGFAVKVMQTYSSFTVGGSISVNCHGRYVGLGPLILSLRSITLMLHDGELVTASPDDNAELFYAAVGGYGALGIIVEAVLELAENRRLERLSKKMPFARYYQFFCERVRDNPGAVFHNADMVPPSFDTVRAITWQVTDKPATRRKLKDGRKLYLRERYMLWAITETPLGHLRREYLYEPLLYLRPAVKYRNEEADYDVAELEPLSRSEKTYLLQEYFVPVAHMAAFVSRMSEILTRFEVQVVNVSIRHAYADPGSLLAWAREEVFALVLYYKQGTGKAECEQVGVWTRELIDAVIDCSGSYYLPYQPHARADQFHAAYPRAKELFALKDEIDPNYRFRSSLWDRYYPKDTQQGTHESSQAGATAGSEFLTVYGRTELRDDFYRFLQVIYHLYPEHRFHRLIADACERFDNDDEIYEDVAKRLPGIKTLLSELTYALPALKTQKQEMLRQTIEILPYRQAYDGYLEIGSTGRYVKQLKKGLNIGGLVYLTNDIVPDNSPPEIMERGGLRKVGRFFPLDDYTPIPTAVICDASLDLVTCYIGLHHCPASRLDPYLASIRRVLRPGGHFVLRDHDAGTAEMKTFVSLVHTVFNAGLGVSRDKDLEELRLFEGLDHWIDAVTRHGFEDSGKRLLQANDPSLNTLVCFTKP